jgi:uncharacterized protein involved in exopolysaccharide biosynthesis
MSADEQRIRNGINNLRGALAISRTSGDAQVINITITWDDPVRAAQLANAVADAYVVDQLDARLEAAKRASGWLSDRIAELRRQLGNAEDAVGKFRKEHGLTRSGPTVALNEQQLTELNGKLIAARTEAAEKKARVDFIADLAAGKKTLDSLPDSLQPTSTMMDGLRQKLAEASQREADLLARYNRSHPAVVNVEAEKRDIQRTIAAETQRMAESVKTDYALAKARLDAIQQTMDEATGQGPLDNDVAVRLRELERSAAVNKTLFEDFLQKAKITDEQSTFRAQDVRVIMPAQPGGQNFPNTRKILLTALVAGLGLGIGGALAMEMLRAGYTSPREVEEALGIPVLSSVRRLKKSELVKDGKIIQVPFYQIYHPLSPFSEAMRTLRSGIHMSDVDQPPRVIHVNGAARRRQNNHCGQLRHLGRAGRPQGRAGRRRSSSSCSIMPQRRVGFTPQEFRAARLVASEANIRPTTDRSQRRPWILWAKRSSFSSDISVGIAGRVAGRLFAFLFIIAASSRPRLACCCGSIDA